ncbi:MAG: tryptophan synthase subunit alpha [Deltaproteobacteria bacterium]|nr:tryptophan synthase subunit alpha [Deltaproteobacteria bacterium]
MITESLKNNMTDRIKNTFDTLAERGEKAFIAYIMAGDPGIEKTQVYVEALISGGADIIELGMPFSDPIADGPTIQKAAQRALQSKTNITKILTLVGNMRKISGIPVILMGYINPVLKYGVTRFFKDAAYNGVDGVILPDLPLEEIDNVKKYAEQAGIDMILLAAPTSDRERLLELSKHTRGFLYYISTTGVTGSAKKIDSKVFDSIKWIKRHTKKPVVVGFGISTPQQAAMVSSIADGIVVGSAFIKFIEKSKDAREQLKALAHELKIAISEK